MPIYMDADACPVKAEIYRVARRYEIKVYVVANSPLRVPAEDLIELAVVKGGFDAADDWIAERIAFGDIAITADIPLADRCLKRGARVLGPKGVEFPEDANGNEGKLMDTLNIQHYPTIFVLDPSGVIRYKEIRGEELEKAVDKLLDEAKTKPAKAA